MTGYNELRDGQEFYGTMCSMSESIIGENVCYDILKYLKDKKGGME